MQCPKCSASIDANSRFCGRCGQRLEAVPTAAAAAPAPAFAGATLAVSPATNAELMPRFLERIKNILFKPKLEWPVIEGEPTTIGQLYLGYVMPLAAFAALMTFLRISLIGVHLPFGDALRLPMGAGIERALYALVMSLVGLFLVGLIINALAPAFAGTRDQRQALKVAAYAFTPAWLSSVLALSPLLPTLLQWIAFFYGIYVLHLGLPVLMQSSKERAFGYTATVVLCTFLLGIVIAGASMLAGHFGMGSAHSGVTPAAQSAAREQGATQLGNAIGNALGTDQKGKAGLSTALSNLVKAGNASEAPSAGGADFQGTGAGTPNTGSAVGGLVTALGGALGGNHPVTTVDFNALKALLPASLPGMTRTDAQAENRAAVGVKASGAKASYVGRNGSQVHIEITDISAVSGLLDVAGALVEKTTSQSDAGFERDQTIDGRSVHEKYDAPARQGELNVIVAKRFEVDVDGNGLDMNALEQALGQVDLSRLEAMKDAGAQAQ